MIAVGRVRGFLAPERPYTCEAELCDGLITIARAQGFQVFPETEGHDLLLVAGEHCKGFQPGDQIGVQAKMVCNMKVLAQSIPHQGVLHKGPHYYATLTPMADYEFATICRGLKITCITHQNIEDTDWYPLHKLRWYRHTPKTLCWVPECEVEGMRGGVSGPSTISRWKMESVKLCVTGEIRGYLTKKDFKDAGIDYRRWVAQEWLINTGQFVVHEGKRYTEYVINTEADPPHVKFPEITIALGKAGAFRGISG